MPIRRTHVVALALLGLAAAGCGDDVGDPATTSPVDGLDATTTASVDPSASTASGEPTAGSGSQAPTGSSSETTTDPAATATVANLPEGFPDDVPLPPGFVLVVGDSALDDSGPSAFFLDGRVETDLEPSQVVDDLVAEWQAAGWEVVTSTRDPEATQFAQVDLRRDDETASMVFTQDEPTLGMGLEVQVP